MAVPVLISFIVLNATKLEVFLTDVCSLDE